MQFSKTYEILTKYEVITNWQSHKTFIIHKGTVCPIVRLLSTGIIEKLKKKKQSWLNLTDALTSFSRENNRG